MKRAVIILLVISILFCCLSVFAYADITPLRAGGGGGGGGGGFGGFGRFFRHRHFGVTGEGGTGSSVLYIILSIVYIIIIIGFPVTMAVGTVHLIRKRKKSKKLSRKTIDALGNTEKSWKYENIQKHVVTTYYGIQNAWTEMNTYKMKKFLGDKLYEKFEKQIETMKKQHTRNVLKDIKLLKAEPLSAYDHDDDTRDYVWYHIVGSMVDYTVDTDTMQKLEGSKKPKEFEEYWKFMKKDDNWVLCEIRQTYENDKIEYQADRKREKRL